MADDATKQQRQQDVDGAGTGAGTGVDRYGNPVIDPTKNVETALQTAVERLDDLRKAERKITKSELRRFDEALGFMREMNELRATHSKEMRAAETERLNAIRQVDREDVNKTAAAAQTAIAALATNTTLLADTLRNQVASVAQAAAEQNTAANAEVSKRLLALELTSSEVKGRSTYTDPALTEMVSELRALRTASTIGVGKSQGVSMIGSIVIGAAIVLSMVIGAATFVLSGSRQPTAPIYVPAPSGTALPATPPQPAPR